MSAPPKHSAIQQSRAILDRLSRLKQFTGTAAAVANHGWKLDGNGSAIVELVPGGPTPDGPAEPYGQLICVGEVSPKGTQVKPEGNYYQDSRNPLKKSKQVVIVSCPEADSVLKPAWDVTMDTLHQMEKNVCSGESSYLFHNDRGRRCLRFTMPIYMSRNNNNAPPMMDNAQYKVPAFMRKDFEELIQTHDVRLMAVYDINEKLVPYEDIEKTIVGAVVEITFRLLHYAIPRDGGVTNSLTGEITQIVVLREPRSRAPTGFSRNRVYRPEPSMPGPSTAMTPSPGPAVGARVVPNAPPPSFDYHAPGFNATSGFTPPPVPAYAAFNPTYSEPHYSVPRDGSLFLAPRPAPGYDGSPASADRRAADPHRPGSDQSRAPYSRTPDPHRPVSAHAVPSAAAQVGTGPAQAPHFRPHPLEVAHPASAPIYPSANLPPLTSLDPSQPQYGVSPFYSAQAADARAQYTLPPLRTVHNVGGASLVHSSPDVAPASRTVPPSSTGYIAPSSIGPERTARTPTPYNGPPLRPSRPTAVPEAAQPLLPSEGAGVQMPTPGRDVPRSLSRAGTPGTLPQQTYIPLRPSPLSKDVPVDSPSLASPVLTSHTQSTTADGDFSLLTTHNSAPVGTMSGEAAGSIYEQRGDAQPENLFDGVDLNNYSLRYENYGADNNEYDTTDGFVVDDEAEESNGSGEEEEPPRGRGKRKAQPLRRLQKRARTAVDDDD